MRRILFASLNWLKISPAVVDNLYFHFGKPQYQLEKVVWVSCAREVKKNFRSFQNLRKSLLFLKSLKTCTKFTIFNFSRVSHFFFFYRIVGLLKVVIRHKYEKKCKCTKRDRGEKFPKKCHFFKKSAKI